jgi:hypothetical protein
MERGTENYGCRGRNGSYITYDKFDLRHDVINTFDKDGVYLSSKICSTIPNMKPLDRVLELPKYYIINGDFYVNTEYANQITVFGSNDMVFSCNYTQQEAGDFGFDDQPSVIVSK